VSPTENIICAVDDSASGEPVVMTAHWLAEGLGDRLIVVHSAPEHEPDREPLDGAVDAWLDGAEHEMRVLVGNAAPAILEEADDAGAALIVVGARGRGALRSALLGRSPGTWPREPTAPWSSFRTAHRPHGRIQATVPPRM
jgi:nucleotide-binding universal stress UspA family protein